MLTRALAPVEETLAGKDYLIGDFSGADIMLGHACFMSNRLGCVGDDMPNLKGYVERIAATVREAMGRADIVLATGGLGPTVDDATREAVALALGTETEFRPELWEQHADAIEAWFASVEFAR